MTIPKVKRCYSLPLLFIAVFGLFLARLDDVSAQTPNPQCVQRCESGNCLSGDMTPQVLQICRTSCEQQCLKNPGPPPVVRPSAAVLLPKYYILALIYSPPGCTSASAKCSGVSTVDYAEGSSNGSQVSASSSFTAGETLTADASLKLPPFVSFDTSLAVGFSTTTTGGSSFTVTKSSAMDLKASGNEDGVHHDQDIFVLLLNPAVVVSTLGSASRWNMGFTAPSALVYFLPVAWLQNPSLMPANVANQLNALGFGTADYASILLQDPFANGPAPIDPNRFVQTQWTIGYIPDEQSQSCNGGTCTCTAFSESIKNDALSAITTQAQSQTSVDFKVDAGVGVPLLTSLKLSSDTKWSSTNTASTANTTGSSQTASLTISCPSAGYTGPTFIQIYWDTLYGSFMFQPFSASGAQQMVTGRVADSSGNPLPRQLITLEADGKTYKTVTNFKGEYSLFGAASGQGTLSTAGLRNTVTIGAATPANITVQKLGPVRVPLPTIKRN